MLTPGTRLGTYEIQAPLGAGGMGEVYRARDSKLRREVAIKILPPAFAANPDRVARFQREAELLAVLNHPNIAAVYGLEESTAAGSEAATLAIVMELVQGETLGEHIARGRIELDEAIALARQIADALEAAHERGVIHRDLKPANIKVTPDGKVKVLDFGLAKMTDRDASGDRLSMSPTVTVHGTRDGAILGTAAYMSPEQARGKAVDRRTDIWAFGCVFYEMLTGRKTFDEGDSVSDAVAAILKSEPNWVALPGATPPHIRRLLKRCLQKDPQKRLPHIGLARLEMDEAEADVSSESASWLPSVIQRPAWRRTLSLSVLALACGALGALVSWYAARPGPSGVIRFAVPLGADQTIAGQGRRQIAISADGNHIAYVADRNLVRRSLADAESQVIATADPIGGGITNPAFSPDGRSIAYVLAQDNSLRRVATEGGTPVIMATLDALPYGMSWDSSGLVFESDGAIMRVAADGAKAETLIAKLTSDRLRSPQILPDGRTVLYTVVDATANTRNVSGPAYPSRIVAQTSASTTAQVLIENAMEGRYLPTGHLAYVSRGVLFVVPFDARAVKITGGPVPLIEGVRSEGGTASYSVSATGSLVYLPGTEGGTAGEQRLGLIDRTGKIELLKLPPATFRYPRLSPDGQFVVVEIDSGNDANIWVYELSGASALRRLTFGGRNRVPAWSADGQQIAFQSDRNGDLAIYIQRADGVGPAERLTTPEAGAAHVPESWSVTGDLLYTVSKGPDSTLWTYSRVKGASRPFDAVRSSRQPTNAAFSPDGAWVAYQSNETGTPTIFVQPFPATGSRFQASVDAPQDDPHHPLWSRDGTELFYVAGVNRFVTTRVTERSGLSFGNPVPIQIGAWKNTFGGPTTIRNYDVTSNGQRFIGVIASAVTETGEFRAPQIQVVVNWFGEVTRRTRTK